MATKTTIKTRTMDYVKAHPGCSLADVCEAVSPRQQTRVEFAVSTLWIEGKVKVSNNVVHPVA